jgi:hypothetical protein
MWLSAPRLERDEGRVHTPVLLVFLFDPAQFLVYVAGVIDRAIGVPCLNTFCF